MRRLNKPILTQAAVYAACVQGVGDDNVRARFNAIAQQVDQNELVYDQLASTGHLHQWASHARGDNHVAALGQVTRGEFKQLYKNHMVRAGRPARPIYDQIRMSAPNNICPYCGFGSVETVDHFLPKGRYSSLSVLPLNLVPACRDCNGGKLDSILEAANIHSHPYYEQQCVFDDEWLYASIVQTQIPYIEFVSVVPPAWPADVSHRVTNHFQEFDLPRRFAIQASERLVYFANVIQGLVVDGATAMVAETLQQQARAERVAHGVNSWQSALAKTVASDAWFHTVGYAQLL